MRYIWKRFVAWWMPIAEKIGNFMNRVILSIFYFVVVLPFGLGVSIFLDPLGLRSKRRTAWTKCAPESNTIEESRRQF